MNDAAAKKSISEILKELYAVQAREAYYKTLAGKLEFFRENKSLIPFLYDVRALKNLSLIEFVFEINGYNTSYGIGVKSMKKNSIEFLLNLILDQSAFTLLNYLEVRTKSDIKFCNLLINQLRVKVPPMLERSKDD